MEQPLLADSRGRQPLRLNRPPYARSGQGESTSTLSSAALATPTAFISEPLRPPVGIGIIGVSALPIPKLVLPVVAAGVLAGIGVKFTYYDQTRRFWNEIRDAPLAHEGILAAKDPRNGLTD